MLVLTIRALKAQLINYHINEENAGLKEEYQSLALLD
jgi:hypothetical protein